MRRLLAASATLLLCLAAACSSSGGGQDPSFRAADVVLGQADFASASPDRGGAVTAAGVHWPVGDAHFASGLLLLPDTYNHRVLGYRGWPTASGTAADLVLGQADAGASAPSLAPGRLDYPRSVWVDGERTLVADTGASRVVLDAGGSPASLGWGEEAVHRWGCAADRLSGPARAITAGGKLIVVDRANHRVLVWNRVPTSATAPADLVLGQRDLVHCAANDILGQGTSGGRSARTLRYPSDAWSDGSRLVVVDQGNHRVLLWKRFPATDGAPADVVLGQADTLTAAAETTRTGLRSPAAVASDGKSLWVADAGNHRLLRWRAFPAATGAAADLVLGQADFEHGAANDDDQDGATDRPTARTLHFPTGLALAEGTLVVTDTYNHRVLLFRGF
jgi:hypothetical protein